MQTYTGMYYIVMCYPTSDTSVTCIGVFLLTPPCHVSGYPRQVINVDAAWTMMVYLTALQTIIPHSNYNTYTGISLRRCDLTSPPLSFVFSDSR
jgi:hypothetical protein